MADFSITNKEFSKSGDIQRSYLWEVTIPNTSELGIAESQLTVKARSVVIPQRGNEPIETFVPGGAKVLYPGKTIYSNTCVIEFEEHEDRKLSKFIYNWQNMIQDINKTGFSQKKSKHELVRDITIELLGVDGNKLNSGNITLINSWISDLAEINLSYEEASAIRLPVTFSFDTFIMK